MSAANIGAAIGLANTNKLGQIGSYVQDAGAIGTGGDAGPSTTLSSFIGVNGDSYWTYNAINEPVQPDLTVASNSGATAGRLAQWCTNSADLAAGTTRVNVSNGVATANASGLFDIFCLPTGRALPANSYFWCFQR